MSIKSVMPSNHLILCHPLLLLPSMFPSIMVFSNESPLHIRWPKHWNFSFNISPSNEHPELISFRIDWLEDPGDRGARWAAVYRVAQSGTRLKRLSSSSSTPRDSQESSPTPQCKSINFWCTAFFIVQLSHSYMTTRKTIALSRQKFVGKVMSLLFNILSRLVITFLPRSKRPLILWLQSPSAVILEPKIIKSATVSTVSPSICYEMMGPDAIILVL